MTSFPVPSSNKNDSSCSTPANSADDVPYPLFLLAGVGAAAATIYFILSRQSSSSRLANADPRESPTAACALARAWISADPDPETREEVSNWLSSHLASQSNTNSRSSTTTAAASTTTATTVTTTNSDTTTSAASASATSKTAVSPPRSLMNVLDASSVHLKFGTAGVRAAVGAGYDRLNAVTVIGVARAVSDAMRLRGHVVSIGYDARNSSKKFAIFIAQVFLDAGALVRLFSQVVPTPLVAFDGLVKKARCSVVVTASHNPPQDNGIKVYDMDGIQLRPKAAARVEQCMTRFGTSSSKLFDDKQETIIRRKCEDPLVSARKAYVNAVLPVIKLRSDDENSRAPPAVYTACHGVGYEFIQELFEACGLPKVIPCEAQVEPDGDFPTLPFPNPEEKGALDLSVQTARTHGARLVLANDPDADRFAAAEIAADGEVRVFTGDELATLFADYITTQLTQRLRQRQGKDVDLSRYAVVTSAVSSKIIASMARTRGFSFHESLTGFKWLNKTAVDLEQEGKTVILTYEEAIGFNVTRNIVRDKDGLSAAAMFYELAAFLYESKTTLVDRLRELVDECGVHVAKNGYLKLSDKSPSTQAIFDAAREKGMPTHLGDAAVVSYRDLTNGFDSAQPENKSEFPADPSSQFLTFRCARDASNSEHPPMIIHLRGSGTEPKIKFYSELRCSTVEANNGSGKLFLEKSVESAINQILKPSVNHLKR